MSRDREEEKFCKSSCHHDLRSRTHLLLRTAPPRPQYVVLLPDARNAGIFPHRSRSSAQNAGPWGVEPGPRVHQSSRCRQAHQYASTDYYKATYDTALQQHPRICPRASGTVATGMSSPSHVPHSAPPGTTSRAPIPAELRRLTQEVEWCDALPLPPPMAQEKSGPVTRVRRQPYNDEPACRCRKSCYSSVRSTSFLSGCSF